jgi:hypothetical protein
MIRPSAGAGLIIKDESSRASYGIVITINTEKEFITDLLILMSEVTILPGAVLGRLSRLCGI